MQRSHSTRKMISVVVWGSRILLAGVFLYGGIPKLLHLDDFARQVAAYGMVPEWFVAPVALILPLLEVLAAVGLLLRKDWAVYLCAFLFAVFITVLSYGIYLGLDIDCGCFAAGDPEHDAFSGLRHALIRDLFFMIPVFYLMWNTQFIKALLFKRRVTNEQM